MAHVKMCFAVFLALVTVGCRFRAVSDSSATLLNEDGMNSSRIVKYTSCAQGVHNPSGNTFLNAAGFQDGAVLTLTHKGTTVTATYTDQEGEAQSLSFSTTTGNTAALAQKDAAIHGFSSLCVLGPGKQTGYPASMTVKAGNLTYNAGMVFLTLTGSLQSDAGACGRLSQPKASFWVVCEDRQGGALPSINAEPHLVSQLAGQYSCSTQVETLYSANGLTNYVADGNSGALTVVVVGLKVTGQYSGDPSLAGTLRFAATTPTTAIAGPRQTLMAPCMVPKDTGTPSPTPEPLPIATGVLTLTDSTLFLSFAGTTAVGSSCPGAKVAGSLICTKRR